MPTRAELEEALRNADAAGATDDARVLADALYSMPANTPVETSSAQPAADEAGMLAAAGKGVMKGLGGTANYFADLLNKGANSLGITQTPAENLPSARYNRFLDQLLGSGGNRIAEGGGEAVGMLGDPFGRMFSPGKALEGRARNLTEREATQIGGQDLGLKTTPEFAQGSTKGQRLLQALSGRQHLVEEARIANEKAWQRIAREANELGPNEPLNFATLKELKNAADKAGYEPLRKAGWFETRELSSDLNAIMRTHAEGRTDPERDLLRAALAPYRQRSMTGKEALSSIQRLRERASQEFSGATPRGWLGNALDEAATAVEDRMARGLTTRGADGEAILAGYQNARRKMAIASRTEEAIQEGGGVVDPIKFANMLQDRVPLTGNLRTAAQYANTFKDLNKLPQASGVDPIERVSPGLGVSRLGMFTQALGAPTRKFMLSDKFQNRLRPNPQFTEPVDQDLLSIMLNTPGGIYGYFND